MAKLERDYLTVQEIARIEGVTRARVHQMIKTYELDVVRLGKRIVLIPVTELRKIPTREERAQRTGGAPYHKKNRVQKDPNSDTSS